MKTKRDQTCRGEHVGQYGHRGTGIDVSVDHEQATGPKSRPDGDDGWNGSDWNFADGLHESHVNHAHDFDDVIASGVHADAHEGEDVQRARNGQHQRMIDHRRPDGFEPREDGDRAEDRSAEPVYSKGVLNSTVVNRFGTWNQYYKTFFSLVLIALNCG